MHNVKEGNTLLNPAHKDNDRLQKFNFIVSNPPFKTDFSSIVESLNADKYNRFISGIPNIPNKDRDSMAIYLCFLQHIISVMADDGKAAVVVPTGFLSAKTGIPKKIREDIISKRMLRGVISMPPNIFANTGTNVSILFLDKSKEYKNSFFMDASNLGEKVKIDGKNQKTILSEKEIELIINSFKARENIDDFCIKVDCEKIEKAKYSFFAGQYFEAKIEYIEITSEEFNEKINNMKELLNFHFEESRKLTEEIINGLEGLNLDL